jgi:hypothetical protein
MLRKRLRRRPDRERRKLGECHYWYRGCMVAKITLI